jgi:flagellar basal body-associated protein FliL
VKAEMQTFRKRPGMGKVVLLVLFLVLGAATVWVGTSFVKKTKPPPKAPAPASQAKVERKAMVNFDPFLVPLGPKSKYTLISLSFSLELPNGKIKEETEKRMNEIRGVIYDALKEDLVNAEEIPSVQEVKAGISRAARKALAGRQVTDVYISQFLAL